MITECNDRSPPRSVPHNHSSIDVTVALVVPASLLPPRVQDDASTTGIDRRCSIGWRATLGSGRGQWPERATRDSRSFHVETPLQRVVSGVVLLSFARDAFGSPIAIYRTIPPLPSARTRKCLH